MYNHGVCDKIWFVSNERDRNRQSFSMQWDSEYDFIRETLLRPQMYTFLIFQNTRWFLHSQKIICHYSPCYIFVLIGLLLQSLQCLPVVCVISLLIRSFIFLWKGLMTSVVYICIIVEPSTDHWNRAHLWF